MALQTRLFRAKDLGNSKLIVENEANQLKIEVNVVFRGSVLPVERRPLSAKAPICSASSTSGPLSA